LKEISKFLNSIDKCARKKQIEIIEEIKKIEQFQVKRAEIEIIDDARRLIQEELALVKNHVLREIFQENKKNKKKFFEKNNEIKQKIMVKCKDKIKEFVLSTEEYKKKLKLIAEKISETLGSSSKIFLKSEDIKYSNIFINVIKDVKIFESDKIEIGGAIGKKDMKIVDLTFDSKILNFFDLKII
jgi:hypothetical protein